VTAQRLIKASKVKKEMPKGGSAVVQSTQDDVQYPVIVRAVYKNNKISTIVQYISFS
jgi:signal recognition particle subunit SRP14